MDLRAVYLDILKDRLYTFRADSPLRRGSQTVLFDIIMAMTKLMAPILSFTAEEIWRVLAAQMPGGLPHISVHLAPFPEVEPEWQDTELGQRWERLLTYRSQVQGVLEGSRREKVIGSSLEAQVALTADTGTYDFLKRYVGDLGTLFIVSTVTLRQGSNSDGLTVSVEKSKAGKCERCWNYREAVGADVDHPTLCDRCVEAVR